MTRSLNDNFIDVCVRLRNLNELINSVDFPDGVYLYDTTMRLEQRISDVLNSVRTDIYHADALVKSIGKEKVIE